MGPQASGNQARAAASSNARTFVPAPCEAFPPECKVSSYSRINIDFYNNKMVSATDMAGTIFHLSFFDFPGLAGDFSLTERKRKERPLLPEFYISNCLPTPDGFIPPAG